MAQNQPNGFDPVSTPPRWPPSDWSSGCDVSAASQLRGGPLWESHRPGACHDGTRQGAEGLLGHARGQGPAAWPQGEVSIMRLDPDGCLVRRPRARDIPTAEDTGAGDTANRQRDALRQTSAKKGKGCVRGMFSLLTGAF
jgi:hypothetical protein